MIAQHRLFHFCILQKNCVVAYSYFEQERRYAGRVLQIWDWDANYCAHILPYTPELRGKTRSCQWSSRDQKL